MRRAPDWLTDLPFAHRGLHDADAGVPEHTRAAFEAAIAAGYGIELDVRLSADGTVMVFHDELLDRVTTATGRLADHNADELSRLTLSGCDETIPTLEEILALIGGRAPLLVEIKQLGRDAAPLASATQRTLAGYRGRHAVQSFNPLTLAWFRRYAPEVCRGQIATRRSRSDPDQRAGLAGFFASHLLTCVLSRPHFIAYDILDLPFWPPRLARALGWPLLTWTVRTPEQLALARGCTDNQIFEAVRA